MESVAEAMKGVGDRTPMGIQHRLRGRLVLFGAATLMGLAIGEIALRVFGMAGLQPFSPLSVPFVRIDEHLGWFNQEGFSGDFGENTPAIVVEHNSKGARGPEYPAAAQFDGSRILILGDSYAWGYGVDQAHTAAAVMERQNPKLEVINFGVNGFSTDQQLLLFERTARGLRPDIVVLLAFSNDLIGNTLAVNYVLYPKPRFVLRDGNLELRRQAPAIGVVRKAHLAAMGRSAFYTAVASVLRTAHVFPFPLMRSSADQMAAAWRGEPVPDPDSLMAALVGRLHATVADSGATLVVVAAVNQDQVEKNTDTEFREALELTCLELAVPYLDITTFFERHLQQNPAQPLRLDNDDHWNPLANRLVAAAIQKFPVAENLIPLRSSALER